MKNVLFIIALQSLIIIASIAPEPPKFVQELRNCIVIAGETAKFTVRTTGRPKPKIKWYKEGIEIKPSKFLQSLYPVQLGVK